MQVFKDFLTKKNPTLPKSLFNYFQNFCKILLGFCNELVILDLSKIYAMIFANSITLFFLIKIR